MPPRGRGKKTPQRRRQAQGLNIRTMAFGFGKAQIACKTITGVGIWDFFTAGTRLNSAMSQAGWTTESHGTYAHQTNITMKEVLAGHQLYNDGRQYPDKTIGDAVLQNVSNNGMAGVLGILGLTATEKLLGKAGVWRQTNRGLKAIGLKSMVKV